jgi:hypothetical protein
LRSQVTAAPEATFVTFIDPADRQQYSESITDFTKKLEDIEKNDLGDGAEILLWDQETAHLAISLPAVTRLGGQGSQACRSRSRALAEHVSFFGDVFRVQPSGRPGRRLSSCLLFVSVAFLHALSHGQKGRVTWREHKMVDKI